MSKTHQTTSRMTDASRKTLNPSHTSNTHSIQGSRPLPLQLDELSPQNLYAKCMALARNLWWSWHPEVTNLFRELDPDQAAKWSAMCGKESPVAQMQVLLHRPPERPRGRPPVLVIGSPDDALIPIGDVRDTARRLSAEIFEFPGTGHDLMLDGSRVEVGEAMLDWIETRVDEARPGAVPA